MRIQCAFCVSLNACHMPGKNIALLAAINQNDKNCNCISSENNVNTEVQTKYFTGSDFISSVFLWFVCSSFRLCSITRRPGGQRNLSEGSCWQIFEDSCDKEELWKLYADDKLPSNPSLRLQMHAAPQDLSTSLTDSTFCTLLFTNEHFGFSYY